MILHIDTTTGVYVALKKDAKIIVQKRSKIANSQSERLLPAIDAILEKTGKKLKDIELIEVVNKGGSFTSLRIGVATANALAWSLGIPVRSVDGREGAMVMPEYDREPNITIKKRN